MSSNSASQLRGSALYFFLYMALGSVLPFIPLIWRSKGISDHQIGMLGAIRPVCSFFAAPVICAFADRHSIQQQVFYATMTLFAIIRPSLLLAGSFLAIGVVEAINAIAMSPIGSLVDSAIIHFSGGDGWVSAHMGAVGNGVLAPHKHPGQTLAKHELHQMHCNRYGTQRVWGAIGFGASSLLGGYVSDAAWGGYGGVMVVFVMAMTVASCATVGIPLKRRAMEEGSRMEKQNDRLSYRECLSDVMDGGTSGGEVEFGDLFTVAEEASRMNIETISSPSAEHGKPNEGLEKGRIRHAVDEDEEQESNRGHEERRVLPSVISLLLSSSQNLSFFIAVTLSGMGSGVIDTFLFIRLEELGGSHFLCGVARLIMCLAEVPVFHLSGPMIRCMGVQGVIALAQTAYFLRFMYYSVLENPWWVLPAEVLHGLTFAAMWAASTNYAHEISPAWLQTTIQGVISGLHWGLGTGLGAVMGGILYASLGARLCFRISSVLPLMSLLLVALPSIWRRCRDRRSQQSDEVATVELISKEYLDEAGDDRVETPHNGDDVTRYIPTGDTSDKHIS